MACQSCRTFSAYWGIFGKGAVPGSLPKFLKHPLARFGNYTGIMQGRGLFRFFETSTTYDIVGEFDICAWHATILRSL